MGLMDRLGSVIKSYLSDFGSDPFGGSSPRGRFERKNSDPDIDAAYEELDEFLNKDKKEKQPGQAEQAEQGEQKGRPVPKELFPDFAELGLSHEATFEQCKSAYKELLKIHHPDKHSTHPDNMKKATEKSARVNAAYRRLENWYKLSK